MSRTEGISRLVSLVRILLRKRTFAEIVRFLVGGGFNTLLSYVIYWLLLRWLNYTFAYTISFATAVVTGFAINTGFVFRSPWSWRKLATFPLIQMLNYLIGLSTVTVCIRYLGIDARIAPVLATVVVLPVNFLLTRALIRQRR